MSMIGKSLVHYEISAQIGRGGMGEVYQAKDTKLGGDVAIKVLPEEFARDSDRVTRFQREAKAWCVVVAGSQGLHSRSGFGDMRNQGLKWISMKVFFVEYSSIERRLQ
jgi:serine/threonine protein kinase